MHPRHYLLNTPSPFTSQYPLPTRPLAYAVIGQDGNGNAIPVPVPAPAPIIVNNPPPAPSKEVMVQEDPSAFLRSVPTLLLAGVVTGAAFAIGSNLVHHFWKKPQR